MKEDELKRLYRPVAARTPPDRSGCPSPEQLRAVVELEGRESDRLRTLDHVMTCGACREEYELLNSAGGGGERAGLFSGWPWRAAATILLITGLGLVWTLRPGEPERGGTARLVLIRPAGEVPSSEPLTLVWNRVPDAIEYRAEVLSDRGGALFEGRTPDTMLPVPSDRLSPPGEYSWWVSVRLANGSEVRSDLQSFRIRP